MVYPNPANRTVSLRGFDETTHIAIYDCYGRLWKEMTSNGDTLIIPTGNMPAGIYTVLFTSHCRQESLRLLITH